MSLIATLEGLDEIADLDSNPSSYFALPESAYKAQNPFFHKQVVVGPVGRNRTERAEKELSQNRGVICASTASVEELKAEIKRLDIAIPRETDPAKKQKLIARRLKDAANAIGHAQNRADAVRAARANKAKRNAAKAGDNSAYRHAVKISGAIKNLRVRGRLPTVKIKSLTGFGDLGISLSVSGSIDQLKAAGSGALSPTVDSAINKINVEADALDPFGTSSKPKTPTQAVTATTNTIDFSKVARSLAEKKRAKEAARSAAAKRMAAFRKVKKKKPVNTLLIGGGILALLATGYLAFR